MWHDVADGLTKGSNTAGPAVERSSACDSWAIPAKRSRVARSCCSCIALWQRWKPQPDLHPQRITGLRLLLASINNFNRLLSLGMLRFRTRHDLPSRRQSNGASLVPSMLWLVTVALLSE